MQATVDVIEDQLKAVVEGNMQVDINQKLYMKS